MSAPTLEQCLDYAERVGLRVITRPDRKRDGTYVDAYIVYRVGIKQGKSRSTRGLMTLLKKTPPTKQQPQEPPTPAAAPAMPRRDLGTRRKQWWEDS